MRTREEILREIQWQVDDYYFHRQNYMHDLISMERFVYETSICGQRLLSLLWVVGAVDNLTNSELNFLVAVDKALALLDNANTTPSC